MLTATQPTILKSHPIDSQNGVPDNFQSIPFPRASKIESESINWIKPAENNHWVIELKSPYLGSTYRDWETAWYRDWETGYRDWETIGRAHV